MSRLPKVHTGTLEGKPFSEKLTIVFRDRDLTAEFIGSAGGAEIYRGKISAKK